MALPRSCVILAIVIMASTSAARAQPEQASPDQQQDARSPRVTVKLADSTREIRARLIDLNEQTMTIRMSVPGRDPSRSLGIVHIPMHNVVRIDAEDHDSVLNGAILGGLVLAACAKWWRRDPWIGAGVGALAGASVDA